VPLVVKGLAEAKRTLNKIAPTLAAEIDNDIRRSLLSIRDEARGSVPAHIQGLTSFQKVPGHVAKSRTSRDRAFPQYNPMAVRKGMTYSMHKGKANRSGFRSLYSMLNKNAAGAIIETAGRKNPSGSAESKSNNPQAGAHFIAALNFQFGSLKQTGKTRETQGRLMAAAVAHRQNEVQQQIVGSIFGAIDKLQREVNRAA
jgi:hypothetical protein